MEHATDVTYSYDSGPPIESGRLATWLFLGAETLFFGGLISAWFVLRTQTPDWTSGAAPSLFAGLFMTGLLLAASFVAHGAIADAKAGKAKALTGRIAFAGLLAFAFLCMQAVEYIHLVDQGNVPATSLRWAMFYAITMCHGVHVLIGVLWLAYLVLRSAKTGLTRERSGPLEYGVLYLHYVDVVWLLILVLLYIVK